MVSCSTAAARKVSHAATSTFLPSVWKRLASLAMLVVLPEPLTPATRITVGPARVPVQVGPLGGEHVAELLLDVGLHVARCAAQVARYGE